MCDERGKLTGIRHIVRLKEMLHKWQSLASCPKGDDHEEAEASGIPPLIDKRLKSSCAACDSDEDNSHNLDIPPDVPKGYLAVYVGPEHRRFVIPTKYLGLPIFKVLLDKVEEEFGFDHKGALTFPCEIETFKYILQYMERHQKGLIDDEGNPTGLQE